MQKNSGKPGKKDTVGKRENENEYILLLAYEN